MARPSANIHSFTQLHRQRQPGNSTKLPRSWQSKNIRILQHSARLLTVNDKVEFDFPVTLISLVPATAILPLVEYAAMACTKNFEGEWNVKLSIINLFQTYLMFGFATVCYFTHWFEPSGSQRYLPVSTHNSLERAVQNDEGHKMAENEVKTLQRFASIAPSAPPSIQTVTVSKRKKIVLLSNGNEFLYLIAEDSIDVS